ncbi:hypothetical protein [Ensifer adhaerens]
MLVLSRGHGFADMAEAAGACGHVRQAEQTDPSEIMQEDLNCGERLDNLMYGDCFNEAGRLKEISGEAYSPEDLDPEKLRRFVLSPEQALVKRMIGIISSKIGERAGSVCLNSFGRFAKWISASIMLPPSSVSAR